MYRRTDPMTYKNKLKPFCIKYDKILDKNDISKLQSIRIPDKKDFRALTRKNTTTHQCCENYSKDEVKIIEDVREKIKKHYENKIQKKLYKIVSSHPTIYRYHGNNSNHLWHVDPRNISEIYNVIVCIKKIGNISPYNVRIRMMKHIQFILKKVMLHCSMEEQQFIKFHQTTIQIQKELYCQLHILVMRNLVRIKI